MESSICGTLFKVVEFFAFFSLLPSLLSDLTVGGSPSEPPPVSADFLLQALVPDDQATRGLAATLYTMNAVMQR